MCRDAVLSLVMLSYSNIYSYDEHAFINFFKRKFQGMEQILSKCASP